MQQRHLERMDMATGLHGAVVPSGFELAQETLSSTPGGEEGQTGEGRSPLEAEGAVQPVESGRGM